VDKIAEKEVCTSVFLTIIALYFECRINKNALLQFNLDVSKRHFNYSEVYWRSSLNSGCLFGQSLAVGTYYSQGTISIFH